LQKSAEASKIMVFSRSAESKFSPL
jgi:hypothetical protein